MMKALVMMGLCLSLSAVIYAAPLYQWTDAEGNTQLTAEAPPAGAKNIRKVFASEPPPMAQTKTAPAAMSNSSILMPSANSKWANRYSSSSDDYKYDDDDNDDAYSDDGDDTDYSYRAPYAEYDAPSTSAYSMSYANRYNSYGSSSDPYRHAADVAAASATRASEAANAISSSSSKSLQSIGKVFGASGSR